MGFGVDDYPVRGMNKHFIMGGVLSDSDGIVNRSGYANFDLNETYLCIHV